MIHLIFSDLKGGAKYCLLKSSKRDVEQKLGDNIRKYASQHGTNPDLLFEKEALRNLHGYKYVFNI